MTMAGKCATGANGEKYATGDNGGKSASGVKRGNMFNRCQARENMQPVLMSGKSASGVKRRRSATGAKREKFIW